MSDFFRIASSSALPLEQRQLLERVATMLTELSADTARDLGRLQSLEALFLAQKQEIAKLQAVVWVLAEMSAAASGVPVDQVNQRVARVYEEIFGIPPVRTATRESSAEQLGAPYRGGPNRAPPPATAKCADCGAEVPAASLVYVEAMTDGICDVCSFKRRK